MAFDARLLIPTVRMVTQVGDAKMSTAIEMYGLERLSTIEKLELMHELWDSISAEVEQFPLTEGQKQEIDRRWAAFEANPESAIPWEQIEQEALNRFRK